MVSEHVMAPGATSSSSSSSLPKEPTLNIQAFHQCSSLISVRLNSTNFLLWRSQIRPLIRSLGLSYHILMSEKPQEKILQKDGEIVENPELISWESNDGLFTSWLLGLMTEEVLSSNIGMETAFHLWTSLEDQLLPVTKEKEVYLRDRMLTLKKNNLTLEEYTRKFKNLCDSLAAINKPVDDLDKIFNLARGLGPKYQDFRLAMLPKPPYPTFKQFLMALENHEQDLIFQEEETKNNYNQAQAFLSQRGRGRGRGGYNSRGRGFSGRGNNGYRGNNSNYQKPNKQENQGKNGLGHHANKPPNNQKQKDEEKEACQICFRTNHTAPDCFYRYDRDEEDIPEALAAMKIEGQMDNNLYADSGATAHMTNDPGIIKHLKPYHGNSSIYVGNGNSLNISHVGQTKLNTANGKLLLKDVLVVPKLTKNLISVSQLTSDNKCTVEFSSNDFLIKDQQGRTLAKGHKKAGLYALEDIQHEALSAIKIAKAPFTVWHQRLGHPQLKSLMSLHNKNQINVSSWMNKKNICTSCQLGKHCKLPFHVSNNISRSPLDKIHCDLWGPAPNSSVQKFLYYAVFIDDFSRYTWLYPLKKKSDFYDCFIKFQREVENQFDKTIKIFQSDGGGEFSSTLFKGHLEKCGIIHQFSCPGTPEQNGVAERKHRHIVETGLTLLFHANMPLCYWIEAFLTSVYIINRLPSHAINNDTPFFKLYNRHPDYQILKSFGCRCFPHLRHQGQTSFLRKHTLVFS